jgi:glycosyltransferase involved in cell wall biosynthesis
MRVLFLVPHPQEGASSRCRVFQYLPWLDRQGIGYEVRPFMSPALYAMLYRPGHRARELALAAAALVRRLSDLVRAARADVVVIHREAVPLGTALVERVLAALGTPVVFDFDDAIYLGHVGEANAWTRAWRRPSKTADLIRLSAEVIAGNAALAEHAGRVHPRVTVIPTPVDTDRYVPRPDASNADPMDGDPSNGNSSDGDTVIIGWMGSPTTAAYLTPIAPVLASLCARDPRVRVRIVGAGSPPAGLTADACACAPWRLSTKIVELQRFDIGIMPMPDDEWARGKCGYKALLYMSVAIPVVASPVGVNCSIIRDGENGRLAVTPAEWARALQELIDDTALRRRMGQAGRAIVEADYSVAANAPRLLEVLHRAHGSAARTAPPTPRGAIPIPAARTVAAAAAS